MRIRQEPTRKTGAGGAQCHLRCSLHNLRGSYLRYRNDHSRHPSSSRPLKATHPYELFMITSEAVSRTVLSTRHLLGLIRPSGGHTGWQSKIEQTGMGRIGESIAL